MIKKICLLIIISFILVSCKKEEVIIKPTPSTEPIVELIFSRDDFDKVGVLREPWYEYYEVIGHALGGVDGYDYTNSYEALVYNYNQGTRVFEVDLAKTSDNEIVLLHEWSHYHNIFKLGESEAWDPESYETFKSNLIYDKYQPLSFEDLLNIMEVIPDFYIVLDTKAFDLEYSKEIYDQINKKIEDKDKELFKRFIPQAYNPDTYKYIKDLDLYSDIIFTLYAYYAEMGGNVIYDFIKENKIVNIAMHMNDEWGIRVIRDIRDYAKYDKEWNYTNMNVFIHTVNDPEKAMDIVIKEGFYGIYSDYINEKVFDELLMDDYYGD